jgi:hypothetical protein
LLAAVQAQPAGAVTDTLPVAPDAATDCASGEIANAHPSPWVTVMVCPATVSVPDREGPFAAAMFTITLPAPLPLAPDVIVIHGWLLEAVQGQPAPAVMVSA